MSNVQLVSRLLIASILLLGALTKVLNFRWFVGALSKYDLVPRAARRMTALAVCVGELTIGLLLLTGKWIAFASYSSACLFLLFTGAIGISLAKGKFVECGCLGFWKKTRVGWKIVFRNIGLIGLAVLAADNKLTNNAQLYDSVFIASLLFCAIPFVRSRKCRPLRIQRA